MAAAVTLGNSVPDLAQSIFKSVDTNGDGQVSADEFGGFLKQFLSELNGTSASKTISTASQGAVTPIDGGSVITPPISSAAPTTPTVATAAASTGPTGPFAPIQGFDFAKLQDTSYSSPKYSAAVRTFSQGLAAGVPISRNNLQPMVDYAKANGFANASVHGDDSIDFGDGKGPIDVVQVNESIWFANT